jgi:hypothetical protein
VEISPGTTVTIELTEFERIWREAGIVVLPYMPQMLVKLAITTEPAVTVMGGEHAPYGTVNGPKLPGLTVNARVPVNGRYGFAQTAT